MDRVEAAEKIKEKLKNKKTKKKKPKKKKGEKGEFCWENFFSSLGGFFCGCGVI
jgi:hypothetical protein